jgi:hypothetical protein
VKKPLTGAADYYTIYETIMGYDNISIVAKLDNPY